MASVNKVIIVGNLGRDPEVRFNAQGEAFCSVSIATTDTWKDKNTGEKKEATEWHTVVFSGKAAEIIGEYCKKGSQLYVEGSLKTRKWQDKDTGADRYSTEIRARDFQFLGGKAEGGTAPASAPARPAQQRAAAPAGRPAAPASKPNFADMDDDIPF